MKVLLPIIAILLSLNVKAQVGKNGDGHNPVYIHGTRLFNYNYKPWVATNWSPFTIIIDTVNLCRLRKFPIKTLTTYKLSGIDTLRAQRGHKEVFGYDKNGNLVKWDNPAVWFNIHQINFDTSAINCDSLEIIMNQAYSNRAGKTLKTASHQKWNEFSTYDSNGYLIERKTIKRGVFKKDSSPFRATINEIKKIGYSKDYRQAYVVGCREQKAKFENCHFHGLYMITLDSVYNVNKEYFFKIIGNDTIFKHGREFEYEYY